MTDTAVIEQRMRDANPIPTLDDIDQDELTRAVAEVHTRRAAAMQAPTQHPTQPAPPAAPWRHRRRKALAFAAAFVLVLITVGIVALVLSRSDAPVADEPTPTQPVQIESLQWTRVPLNRLDRDVFLAMDPEAIPEGLTLAEHLQRYQTVVEVTDITQGGPGLVAVGWTLQSGVDIATVWTSVDGIAWSRVPSDPEVFGGGVMKAVTTGGPGLVGVGSYGDAAAVWTSPDGYVWNRVPQDPVTSPDNSALHQVIAAGPGLVALGADETSSFVWTSPDGYAWTRVPDDEGVFERSMVSSVTAGGPALSPSASTDPAGQNRHPPWYGPPQTGTPGPEPPTTKQSSVPPTVTVCTFST